jgi:8-oxo-dGTP pyrophosphatase MutT (NUDIX family)
VSDATIPFLRRLLATRDPRRVPAQPPLREAAVALVIAPADGSTASLLFIKRAEHPDDPWSGQIALPGGRRDPSDADLLSTAIRETGEETGVFLAPDQVVGELDDLSPVSPHLPPLVVRPFVFAVPRVPSVRLSAEATQHLWVPCDDLLAHRTEETVVIRDQTLRVPGYRIGPHFIWGMTERIVTPFLYLFHQA